MSRSIRKIAVIGAGTMGHGIAQVAAMAGYEACLTDTNEETLNSALSHITANLQAGVDRGVVSSDLKEVTISRLAIGTLSEALVKVDLVVEAIVEDLAIKQALMLEIERRVSKETILASNTSSLPIRKIGSGLVHPGRMIGMHFFNPVHIMKLVEVVVSEKTSMKVRDAVVACAGKMGKEAIVVKDVPGFATSRLGVVIGLEAIRMLEQEVASAEDIDKAMELGYKHPMGPLRLTDLVGLDVRLAIARTLHEELGAEQFRPPALLEKKVAAGELGRKSGRGFYKWPE
ncbi:MAG: 3-hydroxyacyl-CoA dehydrogenase family protein [Gemmatimonadetes bacterium]|nr:3-hydroxyacyl-CoA dehydrogenase family protein [Gemmatimonadota bacterium]